VGLFRAPLTLNTIEQIFQRQSWRYEIAENSLVTVFESVPMLISVDERREIFLLEVPLVPGRGMTGYRPARPESERDVGLFIASVNYRLALGAFTRDHRDGEIRYEVSVPVAGGVLSDEQVQQVISVAVAAVTARGPTIVALLTGRITLQRALGELEGGQGMSPAMVV
jgi:Putative bacterial sensory transduction regulator